MDGCGDSMGFMKTLVGITVGGLVGGPLGMVAGAAVVNDPSVKLVEIVV